MNSKIIGTGSFLPKKAMSNDDLAQFLDTSDEWISTRTGIRQRMCADYRNDESCSDMAIHASKKALAMADIDASDLDMIITATITPDYRLPTVSCQLQEAIGAKGVPAFDLSAACAGSLYGLSLADALIKNQSHQNVLVVASEAMSSLINWQDRNTAVLFGDGASAAVVSRCDSATKGFIDFDLYADGCQQKTIWVKAGGSKNPIDKDAISNGDDKIFMNGRETYKFAVRAMCDTVEKICADNGVDMQDIAFAVPHQANLRIIEAIAKRLNIPMDRFLINLDRYANTSAASLLLAYDEANRQHRFKSDDLILMLAIGAGFVWGAALYRV